MNDPVDLTNHFLIAMPNLGDPNFFQAAIYICDHNADGTLGIVINKPIDHVNLGRVFDQMDIEVSVPRVAEQPLFRGGPVQQEHGFVLHRPVGGWRGTMRCSDELGLTTSKDILTAIAQGEGPKDSLIALGYAGWGAGQLEQELAENAWLSTYADPQILFETPPERRWHAAAGLLGVDLNLLSGDAGHA